MAQDTQYAKNPPLLEKDLPADPLTQFVHWLEDAVLAGMIEPGAMTLATADARGRPSARIVLFKGFYKGEFTFYTNYEGRKGRELAKNRNVALTFWWDKLERSVRIEGQVKKLPKKISEDYFHSRPRGSQLGALSSQQSKIVRSREVLDARLEKNMQTLEGREVPLPSFWGGYSVKPKSIEFWQGRRNRMHDRLVYQRGSKRWKVTRLQP